MNSQKLKTALSNELKFWCEWNGLPYESADDLLAGQILTEYQRSYLANFELRWEESDELEFEEYEQALEAKVDAVVKEFEDADHEVHEILYPEMCFRCTNKISGFDSHVVVDKDGSYTEYDMEGNEI